MHPACRISPFRARAFIRCGCKHGGPLLDLGFGIDERRVRAVERVVFGYVVLVIAFRESECLIRGWEDSGATARGGEDEEEEDDGVKNHFDLSLSSRWGPRTYDDMCMHCNPGSKSGLFGIISEIGQCNVYLSEHQY